MHETDIKEKLDAYRRRRRREEMTNSIKNAIQNVLPWNSGKFVEEQLLPASPDDAEDIQDNESISSEDSVDHSQYTVLRKVIKLLYFLLWATLYVIAIKFEFGLVYLTLSALIFIWLNTHTRPKQVGELSAYSVFNPDCKAIEGTLDASQFEREIRYGIGGMN
ncbi:SAYSvFN domain-containing protein 1 [Hylaeus volcanicus]|uniref:SAYSvFN domain-containing protein 1 n=1 Tax=Hylaeus volcanicus TaxID=313075 RepID=UPI0023B825F5|nr:SAYSvFN domain-containing protein 1 [Hylaeus volcanicus]